jgi:hypothetical protein
MRIYDERHPETKHGATGKHRPKAQSSKVRTSEPAPSFVEDTSRKTGRSKASVASDATRAKELKDELPNTVRTSLDRLRS